MKMYTPLTVEEKQKKRENLIAITNWCKNEVSAAFDIETTITIKNVFTHNNRSYSISASNGCGLSVCGDGRYSQWLRVYDDDKFHDNDLISHVVGTEVIVKWEIIKHEIMEAINERKALHNSIMNFKV